MYWLGYLALIQYPVHLIPGTVAFLCFVVPRTRCFLVPDRSLVRMERKLLVCLLIVDWCWEEGERSRKEREKSERYWESREEQKKANALEIKGKRLKCAHCGHFCNLFKLVLVTFCLIEETFWFFKKCNYTKPLWARMSLTDGVLSRPSLQSQLLELPGEIIAETWRLPACRDKMTFAFWERACNNHWPISPCS